MRSFVNQRGGTGCGDLGAFGGVTVLEAGAGADEGNEVGCGDHAPGSASLNPMARAAAGLPAQRVALGPKRTVPSGLSRRLTQLSVAVKCAATRSAVSRTCPG